MDLSTGSLGRAELCSGMYDVQSLNTRVERILRNRYLLKHSLCLRTVKITSNKEMHQMVEVLAFVLIGSKTCKLVFDYEVTVLYKGHMMLHLHSIFLQVE